MLQILGAGITILVVRAKNEIFASVLNRILVPVLVGAVVHISALLGAIQTTCSHEPDVIGPGLVCNGGMGFRWAIVLFGIAFLGTPLIVTHLLRRAGQMSAASIAWSAQTVVVGASAVLLWPLLKSGGIHPGGALLWEIATQVVIVPCYIVILCVWAQRRTPLH